MLRAMAGPDASGAPLRRAKPRLRPLPPDDLGDTARQLRWRTTPARDGQQLNEPRTPLRWAWHPFFQRGDFLVTPIMPTTAFAHDQRPLRQRRIAV